MKNSIAKALTVKDGKTIVSVADLVIGMFADDKTIIKRWFTSPTGYRTYNIGIPNDEAFRNGFRTYCAIRGWYITDYEKATTYKRMSYAFHKMKEDLGLPKDAKASWKGWRQPKDDFSSLNPFIDEIYEENEHQNVPGYDEEEEVQEGPRATLDKKLVMSIFEIMYKLWEAKKIIIAQCDDKFIALCNIVEFEAMNGFITQWQYTQIISMSKWLMKVLYDKSILEWLKDHSDTEIPDWEATYEKLHIVQYDDIVITDIEDAVEVIEPYCMVE